MIEKWLNPWHPIGHEGDCRALLFAELEREVDSVHPLHGLTATAVGARKDNDDVLFVLADGPLAVVHLTWIGKQDRSPWPTTDLYPTVEAFVLDRMMRDHAGWGFCLPDSQDGQVGLGDRVRFRSSELTERLGVAGLLGLVCSETAPSLTDVVIEGACPRDFAVMILVDGRTEVVWLAPDHVEFVGHTPGEQILFFTKRIIRSASGEWMMEQ